MPIEVKVPTVGESITSGILGVWNKPDGSYVKSGDPIFEIETDKVTSESSRKAQVRLKILRQGRRHRANRPGRGQHRRKARCSRSCGGSKEAAAPAAKENGAKEKPSASKPQRPSLPVLLAVKMSTIFHRRSLSGRGERRRSLQDFRHR